MSTLSIGITAGSRIQIGSGLLDAHVLQVEEVNPGGNVSVTVDGKPFHISKLERTEILPEVFISYGQSQTSSTHHGGHRLAFEAPRDVKITRLERQGHAAV